MSIKQDGLSQLLSSYGSDESDDSGSDKENLDEKEKKTIKSVKKGNSHEAGDRCEDCSEQDSKTEREILPLPSGVLDMFKEDSMPEDEPSKHDGRVRTFSHFPGNWAMHVFIPFKASVHFESLVVSVAECLSAVTSREVHMIPCDELHMSVSRTVPIRHYWIEPIVQQLRNGLSTMHSFVSALQWPELYTNDEKTRSFVALKIMSEYKKFKDIVDLVNEVFQEFSLPAFYKDPSFHVSVAWLLGDICSESTQDIQTKLQEVFDAHVCEKEVARSLVLEVTEDWTPDSAQRTCATAFFKIANMDEMLVGLRIHVRIFYKKQKILAKKLENWEQIAENRNGYLAEKDNEIRQMLQQINDLKRQLEVEHLCLNLSLKDAKHAFEKHKLELRNKMEKAAALHENEKRGLQKVLFESKQEIFQLKNRLEESVQETATVTENFKNFYEDYLKLEEDLSIIEQHLIPVQKQFQELAKAFNMDPEELHYKLDELKIALSNSENAGNLIEVLVKTLLVADKDEVTPKDSQMASSNGGSSGSASFSEPQVKPGSSSDFEQSDPSCPFSQKFFPEQLDNSVHNEAEKKDKREKGRVAWSKLGFKIPRIPLRQRKTRN